MTRVRLKGRSGFFGLLGRGRGSLIDAGFAANDQSVIFDSAGKAARIVAVMRVAVSPKLSANPDYRMRQVEEDEKEQAFVGEVSEQPASSQAGSVV
jgi:hypothetical protein